MRSVWVVFFLILALACGCTNPAPAPAEKMPVPAASMFMEREYPFSSPPQNDKFLIGYFGPEVLDTLVHLTILNTKGDTLYHDSWEGSMLADSLPSTANDSIKHILATRMMTRIIERQILVPAFPEGEPKPSVHAFCYMISDSLVIVDWSAAEKRAIVW